MNDKKRIALINTDPHGSDPHYLAVMDSVELEDALEYYNELSSKSLRGQLEDGQYFGPVETYLRNAGFELVETRIYD